MKAQPPTTSLLFKQQAKPLKPTGTENITFSIIDLQSTHSAFYEGHTARVNVLLGQ